MQACRAACLRLKSSTGRRAGPAAKMRCVHSYVRDCKGGAEQLVAAGGCQAY